MANRHDQKQFLELLQTYKSDDTKKARRNLSLIGFLIITLWALGIKLTEIKVFGVNLRDSSEIYILVISFLLLIYWGGMFFLSYRHDTEIQNEREIQLNVVVDQIFNHWTAVNKRIKETRDKGLNHKPGDFAEVKGAVEAYEKQSERTQKAKKYGYLILLLELYVPIFIGFSAMVVLSIRIWQLL